MSRKTILSELITDAEFDNTDTSSIFDKVNDAKRPKIVVRPSDIFSEQKKPHRLLSTECVKKLNKIFAIFDSFHFKKVEKSVAI